MIIYEIGCQKEKNNWVLCLLRQLRRPPNASVPHATCQIQNGGVGNVLGNQFYALGVVPANISTSLSTELNNGTANSIKQGLCGKLE